MLSLRSSAFRYLFTTLTFLTVLTAASALPTEQLLARKTSSAPKHKASDASALPKPRANNNTYLAPAPRWVIYTDESLPNNQVVPSPEDLDGYNVLILAFYMSNGPSDQVANWKSLTNESRTEIVKGLHAQNISIMMSLFGAEDAPTTNGTDPEKFAKEVGEFVRDYQLDGVDVDWEDFRALGKNDGHAEAWLTNLTLALRQQLPNDSYFLTHAPVAPWFTTNEGTYPHGAYRALATNPLTNNSIDWFNIQYYNQGDMYASCEQLVFQSPGGAFPHTSVGEIHNKTGLALEKLVIGKPARQSDVYKSEGYMTPDDEAACLERAKNEVGWSAGGMFWEYHGKVQIQSDLSKSGPQPETGAELTPKQLIAAVRGSTFPLHPKVEVNPKGKKD